jgi:hypothetical protein
MRFLGAFFILTIVAAAAGTAVAQKASPSTAPPTISLTISAVHDSVKAGSPVVIDVTLLNKSSHDIVFRREIRGRDLHVDVRDVITPSTKLMTLFSWRRIGRGVRESNSSPSWA